MYLSNRKICLLTMIFGLCLLGGIAHANTSVRLLTLSKSGRTVIIDHGRINKIKPSEMGAFFIQSGVVELPEIDFISEAKCIKVTSNRSIWLLEKPLTMSQAEQGSLLLVTKANVLKGHVENKTLAKVIYSENKSLRSIKGSYAFPVWLKSRGEGGVRVNPQENEEFEDDESTLDGLAEIQTIDDSNIETEEMIEDQGDRYIEEFGKYAKVKLLRRQTQKDLINEKKKASERAEILNLSKGSFGKIDQYEKGLIDLYKNVQTNDRDYFAEDDLSIESSLEEYNRTARDLAKDVQNKRRGLKKLEDPLWPSGLSDLELRKFFLEHGLDEFEQRKKLVLKNKPSHEFLINLSMGLTRNTSDADPNYQSLNKSLFIGYDWHLMRASFILRYFSLQVGIETTSGQYEVADGVNAYTYELAGRIMLNYYLNEMPSATGKLSWFIGAGGKIGNANVKSFNLSKDYNYYQVSFPSLQVGVKYRIRAGDEIDPLPGLGIGWSMAIIGDSHSFYNSRELFDDIKPNFYAGDVRFLAGLGIFF